MDQEWMSLSKQGSYVKVYPPLFNCPGLCLSVCMYRVCMCVGMYVHNSISIDQSTHLTPLLPLLFAFSPPVVVSVAALFPHIPHLSTSSEFSLDTAWRVDIGRSMCHSAFMVEINRIRLVCVSNSHFSNLIYFEFLLSHHYAVILGFKIHFPFSFGIKFILFFRLSRFWHIQVSCEVYAQ